MRTLTAASLLLLVCPLAAAGYPYKTVKDFRTLEHSKDVQAFEAAYEEYEHDCLDNTGGGTGGIPCETLEYEKKLLEESQHQWIEVRDGAIRINRTLLDRRYDTDGTMYLLMRSGDASRILTPIVKERALTLKAMWELARQEPVSKEEPQ